jgi:hypothetical protein
MNPNWSTPWRPVSRRYPDTKTYAPLVSSPIVPVSARRYSHDIYPSNSNSTSLSFADNEVNESKEKYDNIAFQDATSYYRDAYILAQANEKEMREQLSCSHELIASMKIRIEDLENSRQRIVNNVKQMLATKKIGDSFTPSLCYECKSTEINVSFEYRSTFFYVNR